ncbi:MAG: TRAP transporter small permease [Sphaerochaetaceae bacterium]
MLKKINGVIGKMEYNVGTVMLIGIVVLVFASALLRVFDHPIVWSVDASQLLFVWISMFGADLALKKKAHMGVDLLVKKFPQRVQSLIAFVGYLLCAGFCCFMTYWGIILCVQNYLRKYQTLKISYSFATAAVPVVSIFLLLTIIEQVLDLVKHWDKKEGEA